MEESRAQRHRVAESSGVDEESNAVLDNLLNMLREGQSIRKGNKKASRQGWFYYAAFAVTDSDTTKAIAEERKALSAERTRNTTIATLSGDSRCEGGVWLGGPGNRWPLTTPATGWHRCNKFILFVLHMLFPSTHLIIILLRHATWTISFNEKL